MTSAGGFTTSSSSFASLLAAVVRLHRVVQRLDDDEVAGLDE
jgi:hypothetical protein